MLIQINTLPQKPGCTLSYQTQTIVRMMEFEIEELQCKLERILAQCKMENRDERYSQASNIRDNIGRLRTALKAISK